jgi:excisionase family DNA binding protein
LLDIPSQKVVSFEALLSVAEVADILNKKTSWVYVALKDRAIRAIHVGGSTRVRASELKKFVDSLPVAEFEPNRVTPVVTPRASVRRETNHTRHGAADYA